ncbi:hypothetical protein K469DRAFT_631253 [Zopfia rhizophila CBS 207.26]|uniref:DUF7514 domain-containing protein n=1 Tax=Zopfia rhizophila CBS 207.26 TaxID=1314779 RepID=A0A6A6E356_9PEZI|nr:hypothetical protein K469DRAFT_631253 [Zopfia rhizophila CBS 207.26]
MTTTAQQTNAANVNATAAHKEALEYWGYLIKPDKCGTPTLDRLLMGIAEVINKQFEPSDSPDITPSQLAAFYKAVGGNYDVLFVETPPSSIGFIYKSLGCFHSLQPAPEDDGYSSPTIPALKKKGFVTWQTVQILLGPEEHVPFLQNAVKVFDVKDPETGNMFPKLLPNECFPDKPDDAMEAWYEGVAERLRREAEEDTKDEGVRVRVDTDDREPKAGSETSGDGSADERHGAAQYFEDPLYRKARSRPTFIRRFSKPGSPRRSPRQIVEERGRLVANSVRHMWNPFKERRRSMPGRYDDDSYSDNDATPTAVGPVPAPRYSHKRPHPPRREDSLSSTDSESDSDGPPSRRRSPVLRHRRSHEPPSSPREYFPPYNEPRRYSAQGPENRREDGPPPIYGPTKSPLFATQVAHIQAQNYYDRRPVMHRNTSYAPQKVRYTVKPQSPRDPDPPYLRDPYEASSKSRHRHRRVSEEHPKERDSRDINSHRTRSHDRVKDGWDDRDRSRDHDRDRSRTHRYVAGVDGVSGRRYPLEQAWR